MFENVLDVKPPPWREPYVTEGVFNRVEVKPFRQVFP